MDEQYFLLAISVTYCPLDKYDPLAPAHRRLTDTINLKTYVACVDFIIKDFKKETALGLEKIKSVKVLDVTVLNRIKVTEKEYKLNKGETKDG